MIDTPADLARIAAVKEAWDVLESGIEPGGTNWLLRAMCEEEAAPVEAEREAVRALVRAAVERVLLAHHPSLCGLEWMLGNDEMRHEIEEAMTP